MLPSSLESPSCARMDRRTQRVPRPVLLAGGQGRGGSGGRRGDQGERHGGPVGSGGGNPLIETVRGAGIEVGLGSPGAWADVPRAVFQLGVEQIADAALIGGIGYGQSSGLQGNQSSSGGVGGAFHGGDIGPTTIGSLRGEQLAAGFPGGILIVAGPRQPEQPPAAIVVVPGLRFGKPRGGELNRPVVGGLAKAQPRNNDDRC